MLLTPAQARIASDTSRFRVLVCGRKFGKTQLAIEEILGVALSRKDRQIAYLATNYGEARDIVWDRLIKRLSPIIADEPNQQRLEIKVRSQDGGTSQIQLKGWESVENLRGREFDFLVLDETQNYTNFLQTWSEVLRPTLSPRQGTALFMGTPKGFNHLHTLFNREKDDKDFKSFRFTSYDNPHIQTEEIEKAKLELDENSFAQEYMADFRKVQGLIYNFEYDPKIKIDENMNDYLRGAEKTIAGVDFGFNHPTGILIGKLKDNVLYITDAWKQSGKTTPEIISQCKYFDRQQKVQRWFPDPAEPDRIEEMKRAGLYCEEVNKDVEYGISVVKGLIKNKRIYINENLTDLFDELDQYQYEKGTEMPVKEMDDLADALRYMVVGAKINEEDRFKQIYASTPFKDNMRQVWRGE